MSAVQGETVQQEPTARAALLDAALELFLARGFAATRVADIAAQAGISKGAVYLHFRTKKDLFRGVVQSGVMQRLERAEQFAADFNGSASELLTTMLHENLLEYWDSKSSGIHKLIVAESQQFPELAEEFYQEIVGRARQLVERILQTGIDAGEFRQLDVAYTARAIINALDQEIITVHSFAARCSDDLDPDRYVNTLLELILQGTRRSDAS